MPSDDLPAINIETPYWLAVGNDPRDEPRTRKQYGHISLSLKDTHVNQLR